MKNQVNGPVAAVLIVVAIAIVAFVGYRYFGSTQRDVSPAEQIKMMQNMKHGP